MSLQRRLLNSWLRLTERRTLARAATLQELRRPFEIKARLFFRAPGGTVFERGDVAGVPVQWVTARGVSQADAPLLLYFHGGGYVFGSSDTHRAMLGRLSHLAKLPACPGVRAVSSLAVTVPAGGWRWRFWARFCAGG